MGSACARCSEVKKGQPATNKHPDEESEAEESSDGGDKSEVAASSDEEDNEDERRQDVEDILASASKSLKRGKTMAMKEAINTAKKNGIDAKKVAEAEKLLEDHKRQERRQEVEKEVESFFESSFKGDIKISDKLLKKAQEADCSAGTLGKLKAHLDELIITRPLEEAETDQAKDFMKQSCREFVVQAAAKGGKPTSCFRNGNKVAAVLSLDPALMSFLLTSKEEGMDGSGVFQAPVTTVKVFTPTLLEGKRSDINISPKKGSQAATNEKCFKELSEDDQESSMGVRFEKEGFNEEECVWILVESSKEKRDRLFEAITVLVRACVAPVSPSK